jgi:hypothetical protein
MYGSMRKFLEDRGRISRCKQNRQMIPTFMGHCLPNIWRSLAGDFVSQQRQCLVASVRILSMVLPLGGMDLCWLFCFLKVFSSSLQEDEVGFGSFVHCHRRTKC